MRVAGSGALSVRERLGGGGGGVGRGESWEVLPEAVRGCEGTWGDVGQWGWYNALVSERASGVSGLTRRAGGVYAGLPADEGGEGGVLLEDHGAP